MKRLKVAVDKDLQELVPQYLENRAADLEKIRAAVAADNLELVRRLGHQMKGSGGGYGFREISEIGAALEQSALKGDGRAVKDLAQQLEEYLARVEVTYV